MIQAKLSFFNNVSGSHVRQEELTWEQLCNLIKNVEEYNSKHEMPLLKLATFGDLRTTHNSLRHDANVQEIWGVEGDYDAEIVSVEEAAELAEKANLRCIFYTSARHTPENPRWRVLALFDQPQPPTKHAYYVGILNAVLGGCLGGESFTLSQSYYYGRVKGMVYETITVEGDPIEWIEDVTPIIYKTKQAASTGDVLDGIYPTLNISKDEVAHYMSYLDPNVGYYEWRDYSFAIHHQFNGSEEGFEIFKAYSQRQDGYGSGEQGCGDDQRTRQQWDGIRTPVGVRPITFARIKNDAKQHPNFEPFIPEAIDKPNPWDNRIIELGKSPRVPNWLVDGILADKMTMIAGAPGVGKTSCLVPLALTVAGFQSMDSNVKCSYPRKVIYLTEDSWQVDLIIDGVIKHMRLVSGENVTREEIAQRFIVVETMKSKIPTLIQLSDVVQRYVETMEFTAGEVDMAPLLVLDTASATFMIDDENSNSEASKYVAALKENFVNKGIPVWIVAHTAKANKRADVQALSVRGAGAFEGDANCVAYLVTEDGVKDRFLVLGKRRYSPIYSEITISSEVHNETACNRYGDMEQYFYRYCTLMQSSEAERISAKQEAKLEDEMCKVREYKHRIYDAIVLCDNPTITNVAKKAKGNYETNRGLIDVMLVDGDLVQYASGKSHRGDQIMWIKKGT